MTRPFFLLASETNTLALHIMIDITFRWRTATRTYNEGLGGKKDHAEVNNVEQHNSRR
jgi:hypothetical protein